MAKLDRSNYLKSEQTIFGLEKDLLTNSIKGFVPSRVVNKYKLQSNDIARPDLISIKAYGKQDYWWFIMKYNNIDDMWNEMYINMTVDLPNEIDIINFLNGRTK
jgi:hypothetical protein